MFLVNTLIRPVKNGQNGSFEFDVPQLEVRFSEMEQETRYPLLSWGYSDEEKFDYKTKFTIPKFKVEEVEGKVLLVCIKQWKVDRYERADPGAKTYKWVTPAELPNECPIQ